MEKRENLNIQDMDQVAGGLSVEVKGDLETDGQISIVSRQKSYLYDEEFNTTKVYNT